METVDEQEQTGSANNIVDDVKERKSLPVGMNFMEELSRKIGAKRASQAPATPPEEEAPEEREESISPEKEQLPSPEKEPVKPVENVRTENEGSEAANPPARKPPPVPPPNPKARPPPLPRKNSSESVATNVTASGPSVASQPVGRPPPRKPSSDSLPTVSSISESRPASKPPPSEPPSMAAVASDGRPRVGTLPVARAPSSGKGSFCGSEAEASSTTALSNPAGDDDDLLFPTGSSIAMKATSRNNDGRQVYNTWQSKNINNELQRISCELTEAQAKSKRLEEEVRYLRHQNLKLQQQLDNQNDGDEMLRDIRSRASFPASLSTRREDTDSFDYPHFREPPQRSGVCGSVCALFGRR